MFESIAPFIVPLAPLLVAPVLAGSAIGTMLLLAPVYLMLAAATPPAEIVLAAPAFQVASGAGPAAPQ